VESLSIFNKMSGSFMNAEMSKNGWAAVPRSFARSLADVEQEKQAKPSVEDMELPNSELAKRTYAFAKEQLPEKTFNHSMRVVYFGKPPASLSGPLHANISLQ
jgi:cyanamide hydratase